MTAPKIKLKVGGKLAVEPEDPGAEVKEERPKRGKRKRNELKAAHEVPSAELCTVACRDVAALQMCSHVPGQRSMRCLGKSAIGTCAHASSPPGWTS